MMHMLLLSWSLFFAQAGAQASGTFVGKAMLDAGADLTDEAREWVRGADVILSLDYLDLAGTLKQAFGNTPVQAKVIQVSCDQHSHRGWSADYFGLPPMDVYLMCESDAAVPLLLDAVSARTASSIWVSTSSTGNPMLPATTVLRPAASHIAPHMAVTVLLPLEPVIANTCGARCTFAHPCNARANSSTSPAAGTPRFSAAASSPTRGSTPGLMATRSIPAKSSRA